MIHAIRILCDKFLTAGVNPPLSIEVDQITAEKLREELAKIMRYTEDNGANVTRCYGVEIKAPVGFPWR
jgi:hypothetical protein